MLKYDFKKWNIGPLSAVKENKELADHLLSLDIDETHIKRILTGILRGFFTQKKVPLSDNSKQFYKNLTYGRRYLKALINNPLLREEEQKHLKVIYDRFNESCSFWDNSLCLKNFWQTLGKKPELVRTNKQRTACIVKELYDYLEPFIKRLNDSGKYGIKDYNQKDILSLITDFRGAI